MTSALPYTPYCDEPDKVGEAVARHLGRHRLLRGVSRLGLAVSGGADSVALLHLLLPLCRAKGIAVTVLHANHGLREESQHEVAFVRALAAAQGCAFLTEEFRLAERTADGTSLEMAARAARQAFFARCCRAARLQAVATGHQADDAAETLLLRLARGAGCAGLAALRPRSPAAPALNRAAGHPFVFIRPLLPVSARALREWLRQRDLPWCEDASNQSCEIPRNRVRHRVLPQLEKAWGGTFRANLCRSADILRSDDALLEQLAERRLTTIRAGSGLALPLLQRQHEALRRRIVRHWLFEQGVEDAGGYESVSRLLDFCHAAEGAKLQLANGVWAVVSQKRLVLRTTGAPPPPETAVPARGSVVWGRCEIVSEPCRGLGSETHGIGVCPAVCTLSEDALGGRPLIVRSRKPGDRIFPTGLSGSKKIQDLLVDAKIPEAERDAIPVFACGDEVVWVPGYRISRHFRVPAPDAAGLRLTVRRTDAAHAAAAVSGQAEVQILFKPARRAASQRKKIT